MLRYATRPRQVDLVAAATSAGRFSLLIRAIKVAGLVDTLRGGGPFTLFAPTDAAFANVPSYRLERLLNDPEELADTLRSHVVPGRILAADVIRYRNSTSRTLAGRPVSLAARSGRIYYGGAVVLRSDRLASNGVIHELDEVLLLDTASVVWVGAM
jgi:uncharacterized surface protein with fasciclin (FAS1) repeats